MLHYIPSLRKISLGSQLSPGLFWDLFQNIKGLKEKRTNSDAQPASKMEMYRTLILE